MLLRIFLFYILLTLVSINTACNSYIDAVKRGDQIPVERGLLKIYPHSNMFCYRTNIVLTRDDEIVHPKPFKMSLPKNLKYYEVTGATDFVFYYDNHQAIVIKINLEDDKQTMTNASSYIPSVEEIEQIIQTTLAFNEGKFDIRKIPVIDKRKQLIVKKKV